MARGVGFRDAVATLDDGRGVADKLDRLFGGALLTATAGASELAAELFDPRAEFSRLSHGLTARLTDRVRGLSRFDRTERLAAAHGVIVVSSFFEALSGLRLPIDLSKVLREDQAWLAGAGVQGRLDGLASGLLRADLPLPSPELPFEELLTELRRFYAGLAANVSAFLTGLAAWDALDETQRDRIPAEVPDAAVARYTEAFHRLAVQLPEVAYWANTLDHRATRHALTRLEALIRDVSSGAEADHRRAGLARHHAAELRRPILTTGDAPAGITIPALGDAYVTPAFRCHEVHSATELASEQWWSTVAPRADLDEFLAGHLTSPAATRAPLLVLGQPGSGKSVLTKIIAARLPASDFLVVRVVLREVPADADLQSQIEYAVRETTGEALSWPDLARSAGAALPLVILDGFDELLQATGVSQTDYLEKVARFQEREATMGRPCAVLVTTRTAVADRARVVPATLALRLEPFDEPQVERWLSIWNAANAGAPALAASAVLAHDELASQPLLLMMLALYYADGNVAQQQDLEQVELYERLLRRFAEREVRKDGAGLPDEDLELAVDAELTRLSVVAFAMFNRGRQWVSVEELDADLAALRIAAPAGSGGSGGLHAELTHGQRAVGRFFFVHQSSATRDGRRLGTYEFLHATFSEYLVARLIARELGDLADLLTLRRSRTVDIDESFLRALLSFEPLTLRATTLDFLRGLVRRWPESRRASLRDPLIRLFRQSIHEGRSTEYDAYRPIANSVPGRHAAWSCNVLLVLLCATDELRVSTLLEPRPGDDDAVMQWREFAGLWRARLPGEGWQGLLDVLSFERVVRDGGRDAVLSLEQTPWYWFDLAWTYAPELAHGSQPVLRVHDAQAVLASVHLLADRRLDVVAHALEPFLDAFPDALVDTRVTGGSARTMAHSLVALLLLAPTSSGDDLVRLYEDCLDALSDDRRRLLVWRQLVADCRRVPRDWLLARLPEIPLRHEDIRDPIQAALTKHDAAIDLRESFAQRGVRPDQVQRGMGRDGGTSAAGGS